MAKRRRSAHREARQIKTAIAARPAAEPRHPVVTDVLILCCFWLTLFAPLALNHRTFVPLDGRGVMPLAPFGYPGERQPNYYTLDPDAVSGSDLPWARFAANSYARGVLPFWDPYQGLGEPLLAEGGSQILYPLNLLHLVLPIPDWDLVRMLHMLLAAIFLYLLARECGLDRASAVAAGTCLYACGFVQGYLAMDTMIAGVTWFPLVLFGIERSISRRSARAGLVPLALGTILLGTGAHPGLAIFLAFAAFLYLVLRSAAERAWLVGLRIALVVGFAACCCAPVVLLFTDYSLELKGLLARPSPRITLDVLATVIWKDVYGPFHNGGAFGNPALPIQHEWALGWIPGPVLFLSLAGAAYAARRRDIRILTFAAIALWLFCWISSLPPFNWVSYLPMLSRASTPYSMGAIQPCLCILAGYGAAAFWRARLRGVVLIAAIWLLLLGVLAARVLYVYRLAGSGASRDTLLCGLVAGAAFSVIGPGMLALFHRLRRDMNSFVYACAALVLGTGIAFFPSGATHATLFHARMVMLAGTAAAVFLAALWHGTRYGSVGATLVLLASNLWIVHAYPGWPLRYDLYTEPPFVTWLRDKTQWRSYSLDGHLFPDSASVFPVNTINNISNLLPRTSLFFGRRFVDCCQPPTNFYGFNSPLGSTGSPLRPLTDNKRYWDYLGVRYVVRSSSLPAPGEETWLPELEPVAVGKETPLTEGPGLSCSDGPFDMVVASTAASSSGVFALQAEDPNKDPKRNAQLHAVSPPMPPGAAQSVPFVLPARACTQQREVRLRLMRQNARSPEAVAGAVQRFRWDPRISVSPGSYQPEPLDRPAAIPIYSREAFTGIDIVHGSNGRKNPGRLTFRLFDSGGGLVAQAQVDSADVKDQQLTRYAWADGRMVPPGRYMGLLEFDPAEPGAAVTIWRNRTNSYDYRCLLVRQWADLPPAFADAQSNTTIYENGNARPIVYLAPRSVRVQSWQEAQDRFAQLADLRSVAYVESGKNLPCAAAEGPAQLSVTSFKMDPNRVEASVQTDRGGMLVVEQAFLPGWSSQVDGTPQPVSRVNGAFVGTCIAAPGSHRIVFTYEPRLWRWSLLIAGLGFAALVYTKFLKRGHFETHRAALS